MWTWMLSVALASEVPAALQDLQGPDSVGVPMDADERVLDRPYTEIAVGAHRTAIIGNALWPAGLALAPSGYILMVAGLFGGQPGFVAVGAPFAVLGTGMVPAGIGMSIGGNLKYLNEAKRYGVRRKVGAASALMISGGALLVTSPLTEAIVWGAGGPMVAAGAPLLVSGLISLSVVKLNARRDLRERSPVTWTPTLDPARQVVGVAVRF